MTILLDGDPRVLLKRRNDRGVVDKFELQGLEFHDPSAGRLSAAGPGGTGPDPGGGRHPGPGSGHGRNHQETGRAGLKPGSTGKGLHYVGYHHWTPNRKKEFLQNMLKGERKTPSLLFYGPEGIGKKKAGPGFQQELFVHRGPVFAMPLRQLPGHGGGCPPGFPGGGAFGQEPGHRCGCHPRPFGPGGLPGPGCPIIRYVSSTRPIPCGKRPRTACSSCWRNRRTTGCSCWWRTRWNGCCPPSTSQAHRAAVRSSF